ncbi:GNAT family N-acetyltransferase [Microbacterium mangrovi]|uniref:GNAT family N-acetyltransferase n=1 Tax=Microbacterium mangrovi TaxID=1348253 RepID=UPI0009DF8DE2|nr:GNAT family N-acetyltransferase [Microbacterium mangrovi]
MLLPVTPADIADLRTFLRDVDLTVAGLDAPTVRLWIERDTSGAVIGSTGFELSADAEHALIRSVGVAPGRRTAGAGSRLASFALDAAARAGAMRAWLFSRRSGPFWQKLGFVPADRDALAAALRDTHQVRLFVRTGQLHREVAWSRPLLRCPGMRDSVQSRTAEHLGAGSEPRRLGA